VAVNRADIVETKFFEQRGRYHHAHGVFFKAFGQLKQRGCTFEHGFASVLAVA
jgi:hypothetical protein